MREIKFRIWDKNNRSWYGNDLRDLINCNNQIKDSEFVDVMQYTELKDKNGKEIYEGDIVSDYINKVRSLVKFEAGMFIICNNNYADSFITPLEFVNSEEWCDELEVVGNIYENPELL